MSTELHTPAETATRPTDLPATTAGSPDEGPNAVSRVTAPDNAFDVEPPYQPDFDDLPEDRFLDRELSWLRFNSRVLELAEDPELPLLERTRFLAIFAGNLDEFFMVRVAGLKRRIEAGVAVKASSGMNPGELLEAIWRESSELMQRHARTFHEQVQSGLDDESIHLLRWKELDADEREQMTSLFTDRVWPVLTPLAVDPAHPFPYISGLSLNLAVLLCNPETGKEHFARVKVHRSSLASCDSGTSGSCRWRT